MNWDCLVKMLNKNWKAQQETTHIEFSVCVFVWENKHTHIVCVEYVYCSPSLPQSSSWKIEFTGKMVNDQHCETINTKYTQKRSTISFEMYLFPIFVENLFHFAYQLNFSPICSFIWNVVSGLTVFCSPFSLARACNNHSMVYLNTFVASICTCCMWVCVRVSVY